MRPIEQTWMDDPTGSTWAAVDEETRLTTAATALVTISLVLLCGNLPAVLVHRLAGLGTAPVWPVYLALYAAVGMLVAARANQALRTLPFGRAILALSMLPLISVAWSVTPLDTAVQALTLAGTALTGFCLAACVPVGQTLGILARVAVLAAGLDLATIVALPSVGIEQDGPWVGTWRGLHDQKNGLGAYSTLQLMMLLAYARFKRRLEPVIVFGVLLNVFLLVAAKSTTSWLTAAACLPVVIAPRLLLYAMGRVVPAAIGLLVGALSLDHDLGATLLGQLPGLVGKDSTLSNRLPVWEVLAPYIEARPWLGYGYGAFWTDVYMPGEVFLRQIKFLPGSAHSSIVEVRLGLGVLGLLAVAFVILQFVGRLWHSDALGAVDDARALVPFGYAVLTYIVLQSLTESVLLTRNDLLWVLIVWMVTRLGMVTARP